MIPEVGPLKLLINRRIVAITTEISATIPLMDNDTDHVQIETPLRLDFGLYTLDIYNVWTYSSELSTRVEELKGQELTSIQTISETLEFRFSSTDAITIDMSDNGYIGPEAVVLNGPDNLIVVWN